MYTYIHIHTHRYTHTYIYTHISICRQRAAREPDTKVMECITQIFLGGLGSELSKEVLHGIFTQASASYVLASAYYLPDLLLSCFLLQSKRSGSFHSAGRSAVMSSQWLGFTFLGLGSWEVKGSHLRGFRGSGCFRVS